MYYEPEERNLYQDPMEYDYRKQPVPAKWWEGKGSLGRRAAALAAGLLLLGGVAGGALYGVNRLLADEAADETAVSIAEDVGYATPISRVIDLIEALMT